MLLVSGAQLLGVMTRHVPDEGVAFLYLLAPFRIVNTYGLFAVMTTERPEIIIEGSNDGETWLPYEFPFKAGDLNQAPPFVAPLQPRLDWHVVRGTRQRGRATLRSCRAFCQSMLRWRFRLPALIRTRGSRC